MKMRVKDSMNVLSVLGSQWVKQGGNGNIPKLSFDFLKHDMKKSGNNNCKSKHIMDEKYKF